MSRKTVVTVSIGVLAVVAALVVWFVSGRGPRVPDFSEKKPEQIRQYLASDQFRNLDRETRRTIAREAMEQMMTSRAKEYCELPAEQRVAYLDKVIDEMQSRRREFESRRGEFTGRREGPRDRGREGGRQGEQARVRPTRSAAQSGQPRPRRGPGRLGRRRSSEGRRRRREFTDPRTRAIRAKFREALQQRMRERGLDFGPPRR
ncbi:MAG TPA: hypothetical protein VMW16_02040 [Sedimentisphaerales bacterium]|nr:hypothetical protein [Sedimentisphaerales bacterium]